MNKSIGTLITALLILLLAGLAMCATPEPVSVQANDVVKDAITIEPVVIDGHGTGLVIPEALKGSNFVVPEPVSPNLMAPGDLPSTWDWRDHGGVTPVKNQGGCGACYAFAALGMIEGDILVDSGPEYNFSEEQSKECIWEAINTGDSGGCKGGWADWVINLLTRVGIVLEADDPYLGLAGTSCNSSTTPVERVTDWYMLSGNNVPPTDTLKGYIYNNGPIFTAFDASCLGGYTDGVVSGEGLTGINHAVVIVGWNDSIGTSGVWICKNSWGEGFGEDGYFYIEYGHAQIGSYSSVMGGYEGYDPDVRTENYDESGWKYACGYTGQDDAWGLCEFNGISDEEVTAIEFWTTGSTSDVDLYLYDSFDGDELNGLRCSIEDLSFNEPGFHSVEVDLPVMADGEIVVVAHINNTNSVYSHLTQYYPIAIDTNDDIESGKTFTSYDGTDESWLDVGDYWDADVALRIRVDSTSDSPVIERVWTGIEECMLDAPAYQPCYTAGDMVTVYAEVCDPDGYEDIDTVVANFSEHGIDELVEMTFIENYGDDCALYSGEVQINQSTCHFEDEWWKHYHYWGWYWRCVHDMECDELPVVVTATDSEGQNDTDETYFCVEPAEPHHLEVTGPEAKFEFPMEWDSKMEQKMCCWDDNDWWRKGDGQENCRDFNSTVAHLNVLLFDQYDNIVNDDICYRNLRIANNCTQPRVHAGHCCWEWEPGEFCHWCCNKLWAVSEIPETVEFRVFYCENPAEAEVLMLLNDLPEGVAFDTHVVTFTNLTDTLNVSVEDVPVYTGCDLTANVSAQLVDASGNPLTVERVPVLFGTDDPNIAEFVDEQTLTDENGIATAVVNSYGGTNSGIVIVSATAECAFGDTEFEVLEGPAGMTVTCDADYMVTNDSCSDPDSTVVTVQLLNDSGLPFMVAGMNISVSIYYDYGCPAVCPGTYYETDENGTVEFDLAGTSDPCDVTISAYMVNVTCGDLTTGDIEVVDPVLDALGMAPVEPIFIPPGDTQEVEVSGLNTTRGMVMCLDECDYEFGVDNESVVFWNGTYTYDGLDRRLTHNLTANATGTTTVNVTCGDLTTGDIEVVAGDPCDGVTCDDMVCVDGNCWNMTCEDGECVPYMMIEECDGTTCVGVDLYNTTCEDGECVAYMLIESNCAQCGYSAPSHRGGGGGGHGGTYPPNWDKPKTTGSSGNATLPPEPEPEPEAEEAGIPDPTTVVDGLLGGGPVGDNGNDTEPDAIPDTPGFAGVFAILGILAVAYVYYRTKR